MALVSSMTSCTLRSSLSVSGMVQSPLSVYMIGKIPCFFISGAHIL